MDDTTNTLHEVLARGIDKGLRDVGAELSGCTPSTLTGHIIRELLAAGLHPGPKDAEIARLAEYGLKHQKERDVARSELGALCHVAGDVRKYWLDWPAERREAVRGLSRFLAAAIERLVTQLSHLDEGDRAATPRPEEQR